MQELCALIMVACSVEVDVEVVFQLLVLVRWLAVVRGRSLRCALRGGGGGGGFCGLFFVILLGHVEGFDWGLGIV